MTVWSQLFKNLLDNTTEKSEWHALTRQKSEQEFGELEGSSSNKTSSSAVSKESKQSELKTNNKSLSTRYDSPQPKPNWVVTRPTDTDYYIGIGSSEKNGIDYAKKAKSEALNDLASEITVSISSEMKSSVIEKSGMLTEDIHPEIRRTTQAHLEGFETIDVWSDE